MLFELVQLAATTILIYMLGWFLVALIVKRFDIVDIAWGLGFILVAWTMYLRLPAPAPSYLLVCILTTLWGVRLSGHIFFRNRAKQEDFRYAHWRREWGKWANLRALFQVFLLQGVCMFIISFATLTIALTGPIIDMFTYAGVIVWAIGFFFESVGDFQLGQFLQTNTNGAVMQSGLWQYTRHPNYFGEVAQWWGIWIQSIGPTIAVLGIISPITITILILGVSGIPMLEKKYEGNPSYQAYKKRVSAFFPRPPRS